MNLYDFNYINKNLTTLKNIAVDEEIAVNFVCSHNHLVNLEGSPKIVHGNFGCRYNQLTTLKGGPEKVGQIFDCSENLLTDLEGGPKELMKQGIYVCYKNKLTSLKGCPQKGVSWMACFENPDLEDISDLSPDCRTINLIKCNKVKKFPAHIETTLEFLGASPRVFERIQKCPFYEVVSKTETSIKVQMKQIGHQLLDGL